MMILIILSSRYTRNAETQSQLSARQSEMTCHIYREIFLASSCEQFFEFSAEKVKVEMVQLFLFSSAEAGSLGEMKSKFQSSLLAW